MALTETETQELALLSTELRGALAEGAPTADEVTAFEAYLELLWGRYAAQGRIALQLQALYVKRDAINYLRTQVAHQTDYQEADVRESLNQRSLNLQRLFDDVAAELKVLLGQIAGRGGVAVGQITRTAPVMPSDPRAVVLDPNDSRYRGDARWPYWRRGDWE